MSITTLFLAVIASIVVWFFLQQRLAAKPWLEEGPIDEGAFSLPTAKLGLRVFLAVVTVLFMLLIMAYGVRMALEDWRPGPQLSSVAEHGHAGLEQRRDAMGAECITSRRN